MNEVKFHLKNFGCQMNKLDSGLLAGALSSRGFVHTDSAADADVVIINTCSVRQHAEDRVLSHLGHLKHLKKTRPEMLVAVIGCMAQRLGKELLEHDTVDIVAGPGQLAQIPALIDEAIQQRHQQLAVSKHIRHPDSIEHQQILDEFEMQYDSDENHIKSQAYIRVMRGCNNFCTYCIVPYVRGPEISRPPQMILEQAKKLADGGIRQITLLGQNVNAYRYQQGDKTWILANLLEKISDIPGVHWVRFITSHPGKFDDSILQVMADLPKVCPYLHIPAQSGSDRILKAMNRGYTSAHYMALMDKARATVPEIAVAGDFIVGFPGETEEDFAATADLVSRVRYKNCFIFQYSPRAGTRAEQKLPDDIPAEIKQRRNAQLLELVNTIAEQDNKRFVGRTLEVLVEGPSKMARRNTAENEEQLQLIGRTAHDYIVVFNGPQTLGGEFVNVKIMDASALTLFGEPVWEKN
jgi:tRNA-2-methylthio-N6-dimethylallyladenosine synthase